ncbi:non-ribosomal peptide synthetase module [Paenibacillus sp. J31TS4]|uniref:non-ribosomal peptide synthetase module n=1 Tax=Paenibacillus sp. J31TS4 TaxID=2807195 RepID=UPI001BCBA6C5|nr:non-ribosomal peptide synthetase module [Paenibacillus sp. J31TS4]
MAQRLATEYVKTCLELSEAEMSEFIRLFRDHKATLQVMVLENGSQNVVLLDDATGEEVVLTFERKPNGYTCIGSCKLCSPNLANLMRKAVSKFKGNAVVNRVYSGYTMVYYYERGVVVKIVERRGTHQKVIYEHRDTLGTLERLFEKKEVEREIAGLYRDVNHLLDLRNESPEPAVREQIDTKLRALSHRLFVLEA